MEKASDKLSIAIILEGRVPSKKNSRVKPRGCNFTVPSRDYLDWQDYVRAVARLAWHGAPTIKPVRLEVETSCRNDIDNLVQSLMDALEGVVWEDDRQVVEVTGRRVPKGGQEYRTTIRITVLED